MFFYHLFYRKRLRSTFLLGVVQLLEVWTMHCRCTKSTDRHIMAEHLLEITFTSVAKYVLVCFTCII